jgi:hypothetical protein
VKTRRVDELGSTTKNRSGASHHHHSRNSPHHHHHHHQHTHTHVYVRRNERATTWLLAVLCCCFSCNLCFPRRVAASLLAPAVLLFTLRLTSAVMVFRESHGRVSPVLSSNVFLETAVLFISLLISDRLPCVLQKRNNKRASPLI